METRHDSRNDGALELVRQTGRKNWRLQSCDNGWKPDRVERAILKLAGRMLVSIKIAVPGMTSEVDMPEQNNGNCALGRPEEVRGRGAGALLGSGNREQRTMPRAEGAKAAECRNRVLGGGRKKGDEVEAVEAVDV
jgi:hypothetical protein